MKYLVETPDGEFAVAEGDENSRFAVVCRVSLRQKWLAYQLFQTEQQANEIIPFYKVERAGLTTVHRYHHVKVVPVKNKVVPI